MGLPQRYTVILPFTPAPRGARARAPRPRRAGLFEPLLRLRIGLGVDRPGLLPREVEALEQLEHPALAVADPEPLLDQTAQVAGAPGDAAVPSQVRAAEDECLERRLLAFVERAGAAGPRPVAQALDVLGIVAVHPVPERLPGHAGELRRLLAGEAVERVGERQQAGADPTVALAAGEAAQLGRVAVGADGQGCGHGGISEDNAAGTPQAPVRSVTTSAGRYKRSMKHYEERLISTLAIFRILKQIQ